MDERIDNRTLSGPEQQKSSGPLSAERKDYLRREAERLVDGYGFRAPVEATDVLALLDEIDYLQEIVLDVGGRSTEFAVVKRLEAIARNMREGDAPEALQNLSAACATLAAYSIAHGRWAVLEGQNVNSVTVENEKLRNIVRDFLRIADDFDLSGDVIDRAREVSTS